MRYHVVTTMNAAGWEQTGRRLAASFLSRWPEEAQPLTVYAEGFLPEVGGIEARALPEWLSAFKARNSSTPAYNGKRNGGYDYRFDAVKFAHKVAAMTDFGVALDDGVMIWIDADTFTHATVTAAWLESLFPEPAYLAWLERRGSHPETGFIMFRCAHPFHAAFMESLRNAYESDVVLGMRETHDAAVIYQLAMAKVAAGKLPVPVSLSGDPRWHHPFINGPLGACLDHMKGDRKRRGRSPRHDLKQGRPEEYWNVG